MQKLTGLDNPILAYDNLDTSSMAKRKKVRFVTPLGSERLHQTRKRKLCKEDNDPKPSKKSRVSVGGKAPRVRDKSMIELSSDARSIHEAMQELRLKVQAYWEARPGVNTLPSKDIERTMQCLRADINTWVQ